MKITIGDLTVTIRFANTFFNIADVTFKLKGVNKQRFNNGQAHTIGEVVTGKRFKKELIALLDALEYKERAADQIIYCVYKSIPVGFPTNIRQMVGRTLRKYQPLANNYVTTLIDKFESPTPKAFMPSGLPTDVSQSQLIGRGELKPTRKQTITLIQEMCSEFIQKR